MPPEVVEDGRCVPNRVGVTVIVRTPSFDEREPAGYFAMGDVGDRFSEADLVEEAVVLFDCTRTTVLLLVCDEVLDRLRVGHGLRMGFTEGELGKPALRFCAGLGEAENGKAANCDQGVAAIEYERLGTALGDPDPEGRELGVPVRPLTLCGSRQTAQADIRQVDFSHCLAIEIRGVQRDMVYTGEAISASIFKMLWSE
jgi:hypothetical protein